VLKEFQLATAELHAPTPDEGVMISLEKPEIRNVLKITWTVVRGILELAIMLYVLGAILEPGDTHHRCRSRHHLCDDPQRGFCSNISR